ncbi:MAG: ferric iron uptake transcriptional regulator [Brachymonas sp.]|nr:ferric iron uptake transcriptional regulator [Brachymonas sp.]
MSIADEIKQAGLKATAPRMKILEVFQQAQEHRHMSAEDLYRILAKQGSNIGLATIYRVLGQFEQAGLLRRNNFSTDKAMYELDKGLHHDHLVCLDCGKVEEFYDPEIEKLQNTVARNKGYTLGEHSLSLYAHCNKVRCEGKKDKDGKDPGEKDKA